MVSERKLIANRLNATKSTGPRTEQGKAAVASNAITHGLTSRANVLPGEDALAYQALADALRRDLQPAGITQREIVDHITQLTWKLRRIPLIEAAMMQREIEHEQEYQRQSRSRRQQVDPPATDPIKFLAREFACGADNGYTRLELYRLRLERSLFAAHRELRRLREETAGEELADDRTTGYQPVPSFEQRHGLVARATPDGQIKPTDSPESLPGHDLWPGEIVANRAPLRVGRNSSSRLPSASQTDASY